MHSSASSALPPWVKPFCCAAPFLALLGFAIAGIAGTTIGSAGFLGLVALCAKITDWVLRHEESQKASDDLAVITSRIQGKKLDLIQFHPVVVPRNPK